MTVQTKDLQHLAPLLWSVAGLLFLGAAWLTDGIAFLGIAFMYFMFGLAAWITARKKRVSQ